MCTFLKSPGSTWAQSSTVKGRQYFWDIKFLLCTLDRAYLMSITFKILMNSKLGLLTVMFLIVMEWLFLFLLHVNCFSFNIYCETVRWYWKPKLRNGVQNPTYYSKSTIYFNNYEFYTRTVIPNNVNKSLWQTGPLPLLKSIRQCQVLYEGYFLRPSTFSWCSSDAVSGWKLHSLWPRAPTFHWVQWFRCSLSWPTTRKSYWILCAALK